MPPRKRLGRAALLLAAAAYLAFLLLFELPSLDLFPSSASTDAAAVMPTHRPRRRELEASSSSALTSPVRRPATAVSPAPVSSAASAAAAAAALPIFSSLLLLPQPNATATRFDGTATEAFAAARPHLDHLRTEASSSLWSSPPQSTPTCPTSISVHADGLPGDGLRTVELPCGLAVGSHVTVVARPEYDPKIAERKSGQAPLMVSQFMVELVGTKAVDREAPPRILHFNPRMSYEVLLDRSFNEFLVPFSPSKQTG